jgi:hypothetical protein
MHKNLKCGLSKLERAETYSDLIYFTCSLLFQVSSKSGFDGKMASQHIHSQYGGMVMNAFWIQSPFFFLK